MCAVAGAGLRPLVLVTGICEKVLVSVPVTGTYQKWVPVPIIATVWKVLVPLPVN